jgi:hypothetical protein
VPEKQAHRSSVIELQVILENGYELIKSNKLFRTPRIPRSWEEGFTDKSFMHAAHQGWNQYEYSNWEQKLIKAFDNANLSYHRFLRKTQDFDASRHSALPAAIFKRKVDELDHIVHSEKVFSSYSLPQGFPEVVLRDNVLIQGKNAHPFNEEQAVKLVRLLWEERRVVNPKGDVLKDEAPITREEVYINLKIKHPRFQTIVRNIHTAMKRKQIHLEVRYPKSQNSVFIEVVQDFM